MLASIYMKDVRILMSTHTVYINVRIDIVVAFTCLTKTFHPLLIFGSKGPSQDQLPQNPFYFLYLPEKPPLYASVE